MGDENESTKGTIVHDKGGDKMLKGFDMEKFNFVPINGINWEIKELQVMKRKGDTKLKDII